MLVRSFLKIPARSGGAIKAEGMAGLSSGFAEDEPSSGSPDLCLLRPVFDGGGIEEVDCMA